ncbi:MAG: sulfatase [Candidatus Binatia bacterium]
MKASSCAWIVALSTTGLALGACQPATPPNVVVISIDSLRADHVGAYGYARPTTPVIDRFAAEGVVFEHAFSTTSWTLPAHVALFTGMDDLSHTVVHDLHAFPKEVPVLTDALREEGYFTIGYFSGPYLNPGFGFDRGFDEYHDCTSYGRAAKEPGRQNRLRDGELAASHRDVTNPIVLDEVTRRIGRGLPQPFFLFIHLWDVHFDYVPPERYWRLFDPGYDGDFTGRNFALSGDFHAKMRYRDFRHAVALYDGEIRYTDDTIGTIVEEMRERGLLANTVVVILSDHGDEFLEHGGKGHRRTLFDEVVRIPLILWYPGRLEPMRRRDLASIADVAPTVLDLVGLPAGRLGATGRSLLNDAGPPRSLLLELEVPQYGVRQVALRSRDGKLIHHHASLFKRERWEGYDLLADPAELAPLGEGEPAFAAVGGMLEELRVAEGAARERGERIAAASPVATPRVDAGTMDQLKALGYVQ